MEFIEISSFRSEINIQSSILQAQENTLRHANKNIINKELKIDDWVVYKHHREKT
jgi:hypothetical protein